MESALNHFFPLLYKVTLIVDQSQLRPFDGAMKHDGPETTGQREFPVDRPEMAVIRRRRKRCDKRFS